MLSSISNDELDNMEIFLHNCIMIDLLQNA